MGKSPFIDGNNDDEAQFKSADWTRRCESPSDPHSSEVEMMQGTNSNPSTDSSMANSNEQGEATEGHSSIVPASREYVEICPGAVAIAGFDEECDDEARLITPKHILSARLGNAAKDVALAVWAPPGKLGVVFDTPNDGSPVVHAIKDSSPIADKLQVGDKLIAVDDENVETMTAINVSKLISHKSANLTRKLSIMRPVVDE